MAMTVVVTRDVPMRSRGFLASVMLEVAPGTYVGPRISPAVRDRVWEVLTDWHRLAPTSGVVMAWADPQGVAGMRVMMLGIPPTWIVEKDGLPLAFRPPIGDDDL